jgi:fatty acid synthase
LYFREIIQNPKPRSCKWISTSLPEKDWQTPLASNASAEYIVNNFLSPVYFYDALKHIPENAVVVEVGSHALFQSILGRSIPTSCTIIGLMKRNSGDNLKRLLKGIGKLFQLGLNPNIAKLYPPAEFPIVGAPSMSPLIQWDHRETYPLMDYVNVSKQY